MTDPNWLTTWLDPVWKYKDVIDENHYYMVVGAAVACLSWGEGRSRRTEEKGGGGRETGGRGEEEQEGGREKQEAEGGQIFRQPVAKSFIDYHVGSGVHVCFSYIILLMILMASYELRIWNFSTLTQTQADSWLWRVEFQGP